MKSILRILTHGEKSIILIDRLPTFIVFSTNKHKGAIDFGLYDGGDCFMENWEIVNQERILELPDIDFESENFYLYFEMVELNSKIS